MLEVTQNATNYIKDYLNQEKIESTIRIVLITGCCSGPNLGLTIDKAKDTDHVIDQDGISFVLDKKLAESCGVIKVDFIEKRDGGCGCSSGDFAVTSEKAISDKSYGCSCSSGTCG